MNRAAPLLLLVLGQGAKPIAQVPAPTAPAAAQPVPGAEAPLYFERSIVRDRVEEDGTSVRVTERTVHARNPLGVSMLGQIGGLYLAENGQVAFEQVVITKPDGRRVTVPGGAAEDINPFGLSGTTASDIRFRRLTIPGLETGDRLEFRIAVRTRPLFPGIVTGEMSFELDPAVAPTQVFELDLPASRPVAVRLREGFPGRLETLPSAEGRVVRRLVREKSAAPEKAEEATGDPDLLYTSFKSWPEVGRWWWSLSRDRVAPDAAVRAEAERVTAGKSTPIERLRAIHAFVAEKVRYLSVAFGAGRMQPRKASEVLATRYGDCKDKHALLEAMAAAVGIEVRAVLVSSRQASLHDDVPAPTQFDHAVSLATLGPDEGSRVWLDSTASLAPPGYLLPAVRGKRGLLVDPDKGGVLVDLPASLPYPTRFEVRTEGALDAKGLLRAKVRWSLRGDGEPEMRFAALAAPSIPVERRRELAKGLGSEWTKGTFEEIRFGDPMKLEEPFGIEFDVEHAMGASTFEKPWDLWLPLPRLGLPEARQDAGPDEVAVRLDGFAETEVTFSCRLPEGMKARAPLAVAIERPFASYRSTYSAEGGVLRAERRLTLRAAEVRGRDAAAYAAFHKAVEQDHGQEFPIEPWRADGAAPSADVDALHSQGYQAVERGEGKTAEELLRQVTALDPKHKYAFNNLGRALRQQGRWEEALAQFDKQIEINPFDEWAWANRGDALLALGRKEEAEKSYDKQIEIAPLKPWAYRSLAAMRAREERFPEAAEMLRRATSADPDHLESWLSLGWASLRAGQPAEGRAALERARSLARDPVRQTQAASLLGLGPDVAEAGRWAEETLPRVGQELDGLTPARLALPDLRLSAALFECWRIVGQAALDRGDLARAERFLRPAWEAGLYADAASALSILREKQGRAAEARHLLVTGAAIVGPANVARERLEATVKDAARREALRAQGAADLVALRSRPLPGPPPGGVAVDVLLFVDASGVVTAARAVDTAKAPELAKVERRVIGAKLALAWPEGDPHPHVRRASVACSSATPCSLVLDMFDLPSPRAAE
jgi:tetratricopeptide (TPR) repeat protein